MFLGLRLKQPRERLKFFLVFGAIGPITESFFNIIFFNVIFIN